MQLTADTYLKARGLFGVAEDARQNATLKLLDLHKFIDPTADAENVGKAFWQSSNTFDEFLAELGIEVPREVREKL